MKRKWLYLSLMVALSPISCATTSDTAKTANTPNEMVKDSHGIAPISVAIFNFENNSITNIEEVGPLSKGFASMLSTDLANTGRIKIVERSKMLAMLDEIKMGQSGMLANDAAVQVGKMAGARNIIFGSYVVMGTKMRIDVRLIDVETSLLVIAEEISGNSDTFFDMEKRLVKKITSGLMVKTAERGTNDRSGEKGSFKSALFYSKGIEYLDSHDYNNARKMFSKALELDPDFGAAKEQLDKISGL